MDSSCSFDTTSIAHVAPCASPESRDLGLELCDNGPRTILSSDPAIGHRDNVTFETERSGKRELTKLLRAAIGDAAPAAAERLLQQLSSLRNVVNADIHQLTKILGGHDSAAHLVVAARGMIEASLSETLLRTPLCSSDEDLLKYLTSRLKHQRREIMIALFADHENKFICEEELGSGNAWTVVVRPRVLFSRALALDASSILLVHNHPSGQAEASKTDISSTRNLVNQAAQLDISIIDHLIVGGSQIYSMKKGHNW